MPCAETLGLPMFGCCGGRVGRVKSVSCERIIQVYFGVDLTLYGLEIDTKLAFTQRQSIVRALTNSGPPSATKTITSQKNPCDETAAETSITTFNPSESAFNAAYDYIISGGLGDDELLENTQRDQIILREGPNGNLYTELHFSGELDFDTIANQISALVQAQAFPPDFGMGIQINFGSDCAISVVTITGLPDIPTTHCIGPGKKVIHAAGNWDIEYQKLIVQIPGPYCIMTLDEEAVPQVIIRCDSFRTAGLIDALVEPDYSPVQTVTSMCAADADPSFVPPCCNLAP